MRNKTVHESPKPVAELRVDAHELANFLVKAKVNTYAGNRDEVAPQRPGFKELEFKEGRWEYRDSYAGFYSAPGMEVVRLDGQPVWSMSYSGGMVGKYGGDVEFARQTFAFLKEALGKVDIARPFRGPEHYSLRRDGASWRYVSRSCGIMTKFGSAAGADAQKEADGHTTITEFEGWEFILHNGTMVFVQNFMGGLIIPKMGLTLRT